VRARLADEPVLQVPDLLLPPSSLREYVGPEPLDALLRAEDGRWTGPFAAGGGAQLLRVVERRAAEAPAFEAVAPQVAAEWRRRAADRALREYLEGLRAEADVELAPGAPR
jgi:parvulin-like peptidyl-prolyl isomerase